MNLERTFFRSLKEALEQHDQRQIHRVEIKNAVLSIDIKLAPKGYLPSQFNREVTNIVVSDGEQSLDLCTSTPQPCVFRTIGAIAKFSKYESGYPLAFAGIGKDSVTFIDFHPDIFELRGGVLMFLHEAGHTWQAVEGRLKDARKVSKLLDSFSKKKTGKKEELIWALSIKRLVENGAWQRALAYYRQYKSLGFDLAPQIPEDEITRYPQLIYDTLFNRQYSEVIEFVGPHHRLIWSEE